MRVRKPRTDAHCEAMRLDVGTLRAVVALARAERLSPVGIARVAMVCGMRRAGHAGLKSDMPRGARGPQGENATPRLAHMRVTAAEREALTLEARKRHRSRMVTMSALVAEGLPDVPGEMVALRAADAVRAKAEAAAKADAAAKRKAGVNYSFAVRLTPEHPCFAPLIERAAMAGEHPRQGFVRALREWLHGHGESGPMPVGKLKPWDGGSGSIILTVPKSMLAGVERVRSMLRIGETQAVVAALAVYLGIPPGRHRAKRPGRHDLVIDILRPDGTPGEGTVFGPTLINAERAKKLVAAEARAAAKAEAARQADAAFLAERQRASSLPEEAGIMRPRPLLSADQVYLRIVEAAARTGVTLPGATAGQTRPEVRDVDPGAPKDCRFCGRLPMASRERQTDKRAPEHRGAHDVGACVQCWEASRDYRIASGMDPHGDATARVAWLTERKGVSVREAAALAKAAARAKGVAA